MRRENPRTQHAPDAAAGADRRALVARLREIVGDRHVLVDPADVVVYEQDGSILQVLPEVVVLPASTAEVAAVVRAAREADVPIVPRGSGTGLAGGAVPAEGGVVVSLARMTRVREVNLRHRIVVAEAGVINLDVTRAVASGGYFYAPDPSSQAACSIGGNVANNSGGPHTLAYGVTTNHVLGLEVVLGDGTITWLGGRAVDVPGYDLTGVFVGSEGTLGIVTAAALRLMRTREAVRTLLAVFDRMDDATDVVVRITGAGIVPAALEMMDRTTIEAVETGAPVGYPRDAEAVLLVEVEGVGEYAERAAELARQICTRGGAREVRVARDEAERQRLWKGRKGAFGALGALAPNYYVQDGVVPRSRLPQIMREIGEIGRRYGLRIANVFHAGDGNLHPNLLFDMRVPGQLDRVIAAGADILWACVAAGGSITGEHGIGLEKKVYMDLLFSPADLDAMARVRRAFDPDGRFNPAKVFPTPITCAEMRRAPATLPAGLWI
ncbi:MAG: FAD-linked oxidase C-terminal domain-containing protein [Armatimonadota bacterium]|nr:FAD-linked oxidase C-terminal domain-containing protein [Armatimonadota bacterium]MDR7403667.1 FAD-linked oxidase C-terminal domain-containing protein [Armatimonadota bacterium]